MHSDIWHKFQVHLSLDDYGTDCAIISKKQTTFLTQRVVLPNWNLPDLKMFKV